MAKKPKITAHTLVKNEENWIWYAINSVIDYVDEILIWDSGSTDKTVEIIKAIHSPKIKFNQVIITTPEDHTKYRQQMLDSTQADWLLIVDGDEIWHWSGLRELRTKVNEFNETSEFFVSNYYNHIGDIFHYQEDLGGQYNLFSHVGHYNIRCMNLNLIPGLHFAKPHGQQGLYDKNEILIQDRRPDRHLLMTQKYLHTTNLRRSPLHHEQQVIKRQLKYKYELGKSFPRNFIYPEVFYIPHPAFVPSPWQKQSINYLFNAAWQTPLKYAKRRIIKSKKSGY